MVSRTLTKEKADELGLDCVVGETSREERLQISQLRSEGILSGTAGMWREETLLLELEASGRTGHRHSLGMKAAQRTVLVKEEEGAGQLSERRLGGQEGAAER